MDIKIIKASKDSYWYANQIGSRFEVTGVQDKVYEVRKGVKESSPLQYDVAPVLKEDCVEIYKENKVAEPRRNPHWRMKTDTVDKMDKLSERSGFRTSKEVEKYERLNKESEVKKYMLDDQ